MRAVNLLIKESAPMSFLGKIKAHLNSPAYDLRGAKVTSHKSVLGNKYSPQNNYSPYNFQQYRTQPKVSASNVLRGVRNGLMIGGVGTAAYMANS